MYCHIFPICCSRSRLFLTAAMVIFIMLSLNIRKSLRCHDTRTPGFHFLLKTTLSIGQKELLLETTYLGFNRVCHIENILMEMLFSILAYVHNLCEDYLTWVFYSARRDLSINNILVKIGTKHFLHFSSESEVLVYKAELAFNTLY